MFNFPEMSRDEILKCKDENYRDHYFYFCELVYNEPNPHPNRIPALVNSLFLTIEFFEKREEYEKCKLLYDRWLDWLERYNLENVYFKDKAA
jgi:hypothetical protein